MTHEAAQRALEELRPMIGSDTPDEYWFQIAMAIGRHMDKIRAALTQAASREPTEGLREDIEAAVINPSGHAIVRLSVLEAAKRYAADAIGGE